MAQNLSAKSENAILKSNLTSKLFVFSTSGSKRGDFLATVSG